MGIQGLLKNLHKLLVPPPSHPSQQHGDDGDAREDRRPPPPRHNIRQFADKTLAVDASSWLHKAGYTCAERLVEAGEAGTRDSFAERNYCKYILNRCDELLRRAGIAGVLLVFDGVRVPLKSGTNGERERRRRANLAEARRLRDAGRRQEAADAYKKCVKGTAIMARVVAAAVAGRWPDTGGDGAAPARVRCVWSPYEADAQLARLCADGRADAVVTEVR